MPFMSAQRWFAIGKETTRGTAVAPTLYLPIDANPTLDSIPTYLEDKGQRGSPGVTYGTELGVIHDEFSFKGNVFADTTPALILGVLGGADAVSGTAAPYTHVMGLLNTPSTGSQPKSWTGVDVDYHTQTTTKAAKQFANGMVSTFSVAWTADGAVTFSSKFLSNPFTEIAVPTWSGSTELFVPAWDTATLIGTASSAVVLSGGIDIKRNTKVITTGGTQSPYRVWSGGITVTGKLMFVAEPTDTWFKKALNRTPFKLTVTFTEPVSSHSVAFQMSTVQLKNPKIDSSKDWLEISADFIANMNTSDAVTAGYAPIKATVVNARSTAY